MADSSENISRIRDQDWLFNALWVVCADKRFSKCVLHIPITLIFRDGFPIKGVFTNPDSNYIERLDIDDAKYFERELGEIGFLDPKDRKIRAMRKIFIQYSVDNRFEEEQKNAEEPFICSVC